MLGYAASGFGFSLQHMALRRVLLSSGSASAARSHWRRHALGLIAVVLLAGGGVLWVWPFYGGAAELQSACWRIGALCGALWLAYDQLRVIPWWLWIAMPVVLVVAARRPQLLAVLIPALLVLAVLRPRRSPTSRRP